MREIKFRIITDQRVLYVSIQDLLTQQFRQEPLFTDGEVINAIHMFTGLKDKNGKEIFEGDIVRWIDGYLRTKHISQILFEEGDATFRVSGSGRHALFSYEYITNVEVIGNIYENPELLETSND